MSHRMISSPLSRVRDHVASDNAMLREEVLRLRADKARLESALSDVQELATEDSDRQSEHLAANNLLRAEVVRLEHEVARQQSLASEATSFAVAAAVLRTREEVARAQEAAIRESVAAAVSEAVTQAREEVWAEARQAREAEMRDAEKWFIARVAELERELRDVREEVIQGASLFSTELLCAVTGSSSTAQERGPGSPNAPLWLSGGASGLRCAALCCCSLFSLRWQPQYPPPLHDM